MDQIFVPRSEGEVAEAVRWALAGRHALAISGAGTKFGWGRPVNAVASLKLAQFSDIELYEPEELVLSARAGTSMSEIERRLAQHGQQLAFEPPDFGPLFGTPAGGGTLGGAVACNLAGPRRIHAGAARDHVLGFAGVNGLGESFKAGGRVVKNVTGFDLSKLVSGSFGTLAVMTHITLKVLPAPEESRTILLLGCAAAAAIGAMAAALGSPHEISGAAFLPAALATKSRIVSIAGAGVSVTALRIEGAGPSVAVRAETLRTLLGVRGAIGELTDVESRVLWREIRDVAPFLNDRARAIWQLSVPPANGAQVAGDVARQVDGECYFDWGGGRIWLSTVSETIETAAVIRAAVAAVGGHATLMRAGDAARRSVAAFQPLSGAEKHLVARLKDNFDPHRIFNPGRMYEGV